MSAGFAAENAAGPRKERAALRYRNRDFHPAGAAADITERCIKIGFPGVSAALR
jgi:hypothetical protein